MDATIESDHSPRRSRRWLRRLGSLGQGFVLGSLLFWALVNLISSEIGARIFRYQGF